MENAQDSSILQQSMNDMQGLHAQRSFYSDPLCKPLLGGDDRSLDERCGLISATTSLHNRSMVTKPLVNTTLYSPSHTTVSVQPNASIVQNSFLNGGVSKADLPYRSLAQFGVLSKYVACLSSPRALDETSRYARCRLHTQMFDMTDPQSFMSSLAPIQGLPGAAQLDMNVSCLFMHEVRSPPTSAS